MKIGQRLKSLRVERNLTLKELAKNTKLSISFISDIENGRRNPSLDNLNKLAQGLGVSIDSLLISDDSVQAIEDNHDIAQDLEIIISMLKGDKGLYFYGNQMTQEAKDLMLISLENLIRLSRQIAKNMP